MGCSIGWKADPKMGMPVMELVRGADGDNLFYQFAVRFAELFRINRFEVVEYVLPQQVGESRFERRLINEARTWGIRVN